MQSSGKAACDDARALIKFLQFNRLACLGAAMPAGAEQRMTIRHRRSITISE